MWHVMVNLSVTVMMMEDASYGKEFSVKIIDIILILLCVRSCAGENYQPELNSVV